MYSEPGSGIKLNANNCVCWLFKRMDYDARNHKHKKTNSNFALNIINRLAFITEVECLLRGTDWVLVGLRICTARCLTTLNNMRGHLI